jgi:hypothetical protein
MLHTAQGEGENGVGNVQCFSLVQHTACFDSFGLPVASMNQE